MGILIQDSFTDTPGTLIEEHLPETGGAWLGPEGGYINGDGTGVMWCDGNVNAVVASGFNTYAQAKITRTELLEGATTLNINTDDYLSITSAVPPVFSLNGNIVAGSFVSGSTYRIERSGSILTAYKDGVSFGTAAATATGHGFKIYNTNNELISDYVAGEILPPTAPTLLTATCSTGIGESTLPNAPGAAFTADVSAGLAPLTVQFTDASTNTPTSWLWGFGDGETSTAQNPSHVFPVGDYVVRLTATNAQGSSSYQMTINATETAVVTPPTGGLVEPTGTIQGTLGRIGYFAVDTENNEIKIHGVDGTLLRTFGGVGTAVGKFFRPTTVSVVNGRQTLDRVVIDEE